MNNTRIENKLIETWIGVCSTFRSFYLFGNPFKVKFGRRVRIIANVQINNRVSIKDYSVLRGKKIILHNNVFIHENVFIRSFDLIVIGANSTINRNTSILDKVEIGENCSIAPNCVIVGSNHNYINKDQIIKAQGSTIIGIIIEDDVWIGANSVILDGVTIGKGSVIAAGSVITKSVEKYSVFGGVPGKLISKRE